MIKEILLLGNEKLYEPSTEVQKSDWREICQSFYSMSMTIWTEYWL